MAVRMPKSVGKTTSQLDRLGESLKQEELNRELLTALATFRNEFIASTEHVSKIIAESGPRFKIDVTQRPAKSTNSIIAKLKREHVRLTQMQDIGGVRLVVSKLSVQDKAIILLRQLFPRCKVVDRREKAQHGYRAVHVIVKIGMCPIEIQIRTRLQNAWAQYSEKLADMHGIELKYGIGEAQAKERLLYLSDGVRSLEKFESTADGQKREMNVLLKMRREGRHLDPAQVRSLAAYETLRQEIRAVRAGWLQYFKEVQAR